MSTILVALSVVLLVGAATIGIAVVLSRKDKQDGTVDGTYDGSWFGGF